VKIYSDGNPDKYTLTMANMYAVLHVDNSDFEPEPEAEATPVRRAMPVDLSVQEARPLAVLGSLPVKTRIVKWKSEPEPESKPRIVKWKESVPEPVPTRMSRGRMSRGDPLDIKTLMNTCTPIKWDRDAVRKDTSLPPDINTFPSIGTIVTSSSTISWPHASQDPVRPPMIIDEIFMDEETDDWTLEWGDSNYGTQLV
jgi:hypothetical protein